MERAPPILMCAAKNFGLGRADFEGQMQEEIRHILEDLRNTNGHPTDLFLHVSYFMSSLISQILFKKQFRKDDPVFLEISRGINSYIGDLLEERGLLLGPIFEHIAIKIFPWGKRLQKTRRILHEAINKIIDEHLVTFKEGCVEDFVDAFLEERKKLEKRGQLENSTFTISRLRALCINMFAEAIGTNALASHLKALSTHRDDQEQAQEEIDEVVGTSRLPSWLDKPNLPYTDALIQEIIRTSHPITFTTTYSNYEKTTLRGYRIPKRSVIIGNLLSIHNDPKLFPNPSKFDPGRFLGPDGKRIKKEGPFTFGIGKRSCIAATFSSMAIFTAISSILQHFFLMPVKEEGSNTYRVWLIEGIGWPSLVAIGLVSLLFYMYVNNSNLPPGPVGLTYIGYYPFFGKEVQKQLRQLALKYGDVISFRVTGQLYIHLNIINLIKEAHVAQSDNFTGKSEKFNFFRSIEDGRRTETISYVIYQFFRTIIDHPIVQERIQKELDEVIGRERLPTLEGKAKLPYIDATLLEFNRTTVVFPFVPNMQNTRETTLNGYRIPEGSITVMNIWSAHQDPSIYPNPEKFDPGRFLGSDGRRTKTELPILFGVGKRSCVGEALVNMEMFLIVLAIMQNFTICSPANKVLQDTSFVQMLQYEMCSVPRSSQMS